MGLIKTKGIVTKIVNYSDNDKILTVITADQGKIQVFCKGAQKIKNSILASTEFLAFSEFVLYEGNSDMYKMSSAEIIEVFYNLVQFCFLNLRHELLAFLRLHRYHIPKLHLVRLLMLLHY